ncbi:MAG: hypothetical protein JSS30_08095 [Verrucomicrobia bacterium]|nr:hypothetical protein [Verrucomicrobiota bacterium]
MAIGRDKEELSVIEAVDILSNMTEVDLKTPVDLDAVEEEVSLEINWRDPRQALRNEGAIKETFRVIHRYLQNIVRKDRQVLNDAQTMKGIQAIILLAHEAVQKMDRFAALYPHRYKGISKLKEYTDLRKYYKQHILGQSNMPKELPEEWEFDLEEELAGAETEKQAFKDLEAVRKDQSYELFFIKNEEGKPYFSKNLIRHIRLLGNFDELISKAEGEDPLLQLRELLDHELFEGAKELFRQVAPLLDEFYKGGMPHKDRPYEGNINKAIMALRMAASPVHLIENQSFKSCIEYFSDFHRFLRAAMNSPRYKELISGDIKENQQMHALLTLTHALCAYFFMRIEPRKEALKLIDQMIVRGDELRGPRVKPQAEDKKLQMWTDLLDLDESLRYLTRHYPNGPLMRTLDMFREEEEYEGYDPLMHQNFPSQLFSFSQGQFHVTVMRIPAPVKQTTIQNAQIVPEFIGFLRYLRDELKPDRHLLINLQDRTSWKEFARCKALEDLGKSAAYFETIPVLGLPKNTSFYNQNDEYQSYAGAPVFMEQFEQQVLSGQECGFHLPELLKKEKIDSFIKPALKLIHELFFDGKTSLTRHERQSFIEIFYTLYTLKAIELLQVDSISFTCKDAIDTGMEQTAILFGFLRMLSDPAKWGPKEKELLLWILYSPALLIRERPIDQTAFKRAVHALEAIHSGCLKHYNEILKRINHLFPNLSFPMEINLPHSNG